MKGALTGKLRYLYIYTFMFSVKMKEIVTILGRKINILNCKGGLSSNALNKLCMYSQLLHPSKPLYGSPSLNLRIFPPIYSSSLLTYPSPLPPPIISISDNFLPSQLTATDPGSITAITILAPEVGAELEKITMPLINFTKTVDI